MNASGIVNNIDESTCDFEDGVVYMSIICRRCREKDIEMLREWRMRPEITRFMNTEPKLTIEDQKRWFAKVSKEDSFYWILEVDGIPVGMVSLVKWDKTNKIIHTGIYIAVKEKRSMSLLIDLTVNLNVFAFEKLKVNKVAKEFLDINQDYIHFYERFGFKKEGVLRAAIYKNGKYHDLHLLGMLKDEWESLPDMGDYQTILFEQ